MLYVCMADYTCDIDIVYFAITEEAGGYINTDNNGAITCACLPMTMLECTLLSYQESLCLYIAFSNAYCRY